MKYFAFLLFLVASFFMVETAWGQCYGDITLLTQEDVDNFVSDYGCSVIQGNLIIGDDSYPFEASDITSLSMLSTLEYIEGDFGIYRNPNLVNLTGLENLNYVAGLLDIHNGF